MSRTVAYMRTSTTKQDLARQKQRFIEMGIPKSDWYIEQVSATSKRDVFNQMISELDAGSTILAISIDRCFRSLKMMADTLETLKERDITIKFLDNGIDTGNKQSEIIIAIVTAMASWELQMIQDRTRQGLEAKRKRNNGKTGAGRPKKNDKAIKAIEYYNNNNSVSVNDCCKLFNISRKTFYNYKNMLEDAKLQ